MNGPFDITPPNLKPNFPYPLIYGDQVKKAKNLKQSEQIEENVDQDFPILKQTNMPRIIEENEWGSASTKNNR